MCDQHRRGFLQLALVTLGAAGVAGAALAADAPAAGKKVYTCPPCGCPNDGKEFPEPGACSACGMPLVEKVATAPKPDPAPAPAPKAGATGASLPAPPVG
ncbi:MAG: hypothetical protein JWO33_1383 [Caulobacteraceae bacterium]|nr:hypothetical protein [Caulobacteraceae bacterium]